MRRWSWIAVLAIGCSQSTPSALPMVAMSDVPASVKRAASGQRPDIRFHTAFRTPAGNFQLRGKDKGGKTVAIDITSDGAVVALY